MAQNLKFTWARQIGSSSIEWVFSVGKDNQGNIYLAGYVRGTTDFDPGPGVFLLSSNNESDDIFICKLDPGGNLIWAKLIGGPLDDRAQSLIIDPAGNIIVAGYFRGTADFDPSSSNVFFTSLGQQDIFLSKFNTSGNHLWTKQMGGIYQDYCSSVKIDGAGNIYCSGYIYGTSDFDPGTATFNLTPVGNNANFISKLDINGNFSWAFLVGGNIESEPSIDVDQAGNVVATGSFAGVYDFDPGPLTFNLASNNNSADAYIAKYSNNGNLNWVKSFAGPSEDMGRVVKWGGNANIYIGGDFSGTVDFDPGPSTNSITSSGNFDVFVCKLNVDGNLIWSKKKGGPGPDRINAMAIDFNENIFCTGIFYEPGDYDPGACPFMLVPVLNPAGNSGTNAYLSILDSSGNFKWAEAYGGDAHVVPADIIVNETGSVYTAGHFTEYADFDPGPGSFILNPMPYNGQSLYIQKLSPCNNSTSSNINITTCSPISFGCHTITSSGVYTKVVENSTGCDSIVTANVTIGTVTVSASVNACNSYTFNGQTITASGNYFDTITTANGCDSIVHLSLVINSSPLTVTYLSACNNYNWNGLELISSGLYKDTLTASNGCDSIIHLNLTILTSQTDTSSVITCGPYLWNGYLYTSSGNYKDTFVSNASCDSIAVLQLTINSPAASTISQNICKGQSFEGYTVSGTFKDSFVALNGCDSVRTLHLIVTDPPVPNLGADAGLCPGDSIKISPGQFNAYQWQDASNKNFFLVKQPGIYSVTVQNSCGSGTDEIEITDGVCEIYFPNAFTPNHDGRNDVFKALGNPQLSEYSLMIYNRWGGKVFSTKDPKQGWNGSVAGIIQSTGQYVWICTLRKPGGEKKVFKGTFLLIR